MKIGDLAPRPSPRLRTEEEIIASWKGDPNQPLLNIKCATFNHVDYICDAIHGFLSQETEFPFDVVVHDDASTDGTADILRDYERRYPRIVKVIYQQRNLFSQGVPRDGYMRPFLTGKYVAFCEGDDYWMDPRKLQIQVAFLEENPDYVISGHDAFVLDHEKRIICLSEIPDSLKRDFGSEDLVNGRVYIVTRSQVYRNIDISWERESRFILNGDDFFISRIGWYGKSKYHAEIRPAGYRQHAGGVWSSGSEEDQLAAQISSWLWIGRYYRRIGKPDVASSFDREARGFLLGSVRTRLLAKELRFRLSLRGMIKAVIRKLRFR